MEKHTLRKQNRERRNQMPEEEAMRKSSLILDQLLRMPEFRLAEEIYTYVSFGNEVDTFSLITSAILSGKRVYVPKVIDKKRMEFFRIKHIGELQSGTLGILEPITDELGKLDVTKKQIMIVPGLVFDEKGNRIGYGGGYYDRYLWEQQNESLHLIAPAYEFQVVKSLNAEELDIPVHKIVTEKRIIECKS